MVLPYFFVNAPRDFLDWAWYQWEGCLAMRHVSATGRKHTCWSHHPRDFLVRFEDLDHVIVGLNVALKGPFPLVGESELARAAPKLLYDRG
jgi:hypothetical protein